MSINFDLVAIAKAAGKPDMKGLHYTDLNLVATRSEVRAWVDEFRGLLDKFILPAANRCQTYEGLDSVLNGEQHGGLSLTRGDPDLQILMAYLANNPNLKVITETALAAVPNHRRESVASKVAALSVSMGCLPSLVNTRVPLINPAIECYALFDR